MFLILFATVPAEDIALAIGVAVCILPALVFEFVPPVIKYGVFYPLGCEVFQKRVRVLDSNMEEVDVKMTLAIAAYLPSELILCVGMVAWWFYSREPMSAMVHKFEIANAVTFIRAAVVFALTSGK